MRLFFCKLCNWISLVISSEQRFTVTADDVIAPIGSNVRIPFSISPLRVMDFISTIQWLQKPNTNSKLTKQPPPIPPVCQKADEQAH